MKFDKKYPGTRKPTITKKSIPLKGSLHRKDHQPANALIAYVAINPRDFGKMKNVRYERLDSINWFRNVNNQILYKDRLANFLAFFFV